MTNRLLAITLLCFSCTAGAPARSTVPATKSVGAPPLDVTGLALRRALAIRRLHDYAVAGVFPTDDTGLPTSVFRDARGVRCPMAELIHDSGRDDLVDAVAAHANTLRLADIHDGPLLDWMLHSGLTQEEIAMVQGALDLPSMRQFRELDRTIEAHARVLGRLDTAEVALRDGSAHSLDVAFARGAVEHVTTTRVADAVAINTPAPARTR